MNYKREKLKYTGGGGQSRTVRHAAKFTGSASVATFTHSGIKICHQHIQSDYKEFLKALSKDAVL